MSIEFECAECHKSLRVPDEAGGKQARCPDCGTIQQVPWPPSPFRDTENNWFQPAAAPAKDFRSIPETSGDINPYQAPPLTQTSWDRNLRGPVPRHIIEAKVQGPAIALIALAVMTLALMSFGVALQVIAVVGFGEQGHDLPFTLMGYAVSGLIYTVMLVGAIRMRRLRSYSLAVTAGVLAVLPCSGCCMVSMPCGIWALVVLLDANVRAAFE